MKQILYLIVCFIHATFSIYSQENIITPLNLQANDSLLKSDTYSMDWFMVTDTTEVKIGEVETQIQKKKAVTYVITQVKMNRSTDKWIDTTVVATKNFEPIYHASYNQQRDMVLKFDEKVTGYYLDKKSSTRTPILEETNTPFFDSNFYPQLIRLLPLKDNYAKTISIFDYNPKSKIGVLTATIKNTQKNMVNFKGESLPIWKVEVTDDISGNNALNTYYIDFRTRKLLKQEIDFGGRKMVIKLRE